MTDRELLELAAKAAGINIDYSYAGRGFDVLGNAVLDWHNGTKWSPLTDDGDALRLAVKLGIDIFTRININGKFVVTERSDINFCPELIGDGIDAGSATRRAIVRAAAEIGKTIP